MPSITSQTDESRKLAADHAPSDRFLESISRDFAREHLVLSAGTTDNVEVLHIAHDTPKCVPFNVGVRLGADIEAIVIDAERLAARIDLAYKDISSPDIDSVAPQDHDGDSIDDLIRDADRDLLTTSGKGPVIRLVDAVLFDALRQRASDVHVQPLESRTLVRYRLDGVLRTVREIPDRLALPVTSRIKVMGKMDIAERRIPQDGRATVTIGRPVDVSDAPSGRAIDLRISTIPTKFGERCVIRLLDNTSQLATFDDLGMPADTAERFLEHAQRSHGMILLTGPTGSGKTTTLYATLRRVGSDSLNVLTIEDPIEYDLSSFGLAVSQSQVNDKKGVTFATGLRHILRQDPDVVMVGEIRDAETARTAIQASLTGHLVLSTLHTNDSASAITRLVDLGVEPYLVGSSLVAAMAQRLVRRTHAACDGIGCAACFETGYQGRIGLFELLSVDEQIRQLIVDGVPVSQIRDAARSAGMRTLGEEGAIRVERRETTRLELQRVVEGLES
ncbi:MAG: GspE/PulE family protein [Planctomycetota bacterium]